jgi:SOS response regulatory protein OraA/RecX
MTIKDKVLTYIIDYIKLKVECFIIDEKTKIKRFTCPICKNEKLTAILIPGTYKLRCLNCNKNYGNLFEVVKVLEKDKENYTDEQIEKYIIDLLKLTIKTDLQVKDLFEYYEKNNFDLVPVVKNQKNPIELGWTEKVHKNKKEWEEWIYDGLNIGVKTGKSSNITIVDVDTKEIPEDLHKLLSYTTLYQITNKGTQFIYKYVETLPTTRIDEYKTDILNDKKQSVFPPSTVENNQREIFLNEIEEMPQALLDFLKSKITVVVKSFSDKLKEDIQEDHINLSEFNMSPIQEGNRTNFMLRFGGILRKELNINQTAYTLSLFNRYLCKPSLPIKELDNVINSLDRYTKFDEMELALKILQYMKVVEEAGSRDIKEALGELGAEGKQRIEKAIKYLTKEGFLFKKGRIFKLVKKADWKEQFMDDGKKIDFIMPYLDDYAVFRSGDLAVIGARTGAGKTHVSMNIIKRLVQQNKKPCYISLESGSRFISIATALGLKEGDFKYCIHFSPTDVELEKDSITIIDWLLPDDYALTDKLYKHFAEQLVKQGGILIVFAQLMQNGEFFAKNMIDLFPAFVAKFLYEDDSGVNSYFQITKIREPKSRVKLGKIPCFYDFESKELKMIEEKQ